MPCGRPDSYHSFRISFMTGESAPSGFNGIQVYATAPVAAARTADAGAAGLLHGKPWESCYCYSCT